MFQPFNFDFRTFWNYEIIKLYSIVFNNFPCFYGCGCIFVNLKLRSSIFADVFCDSFSKEFDIILIL